MKVFVVGARGGMCHLLQSKRPRRGLELVKARGLALAVSFVAVSTVALAGCTLTSESFDPTLVDQAQSASTPVGPAPSAPPEGSAGTSGAFPDPAPTTSGGEDETDEPIRLEPSEPDEGQLGTANGDDVDPEPSGDAGAEPPVTPPEPSTEPDAGVSVPLASTCSTETFGDSCYEVFDEALAWVAAEARCVAWGGHLASVQSAPEDTFLEFWPAALGLTPANGSGVWLGGTDAAEDGTFVWVDGSPVLVNGWAPGQPNDGAGVDCIEKRNDGTDLWYDQRCTDGRPFICERPL